MSRVLFTVSIPYVKSHNTFSHSSQAEILSFVAPLRPCSFFHSFTHTIAPELFSRFALSFLAKPLLCSYKLIKEHRIHVQGSGSFSTVSRHQRKIKHLGMHAVSGGQSKSMYTERMEERKGRRDFSFDFSQWHPIGKT